MSDLEARYSYAFANKPEEWDCEGQLRHTLDLLRNIIGLPSLETYAHYPQFKQAREWLERMGHE